MAKNLLYPAIPNDLSRLELSELLVDFLSLQAVHLLEKDLALAVGC